jgi:hypothetical protein
MKMAELKRVISVLSDQIGWFWPVFLIKALFRNQSVFSRTRWSEEAEAKFVKRFSFAAAIFLELRGKYGHVNAFNILRRILVPLGCNE